MYIDVVSSPEFVAFMNEKAGELKPITNGSEKQNSWAIDIRKKSIEKCVFQIAFQTWRKESGKSRLAEKQIARYYEKLDQLLRANNAKWFIDNRDKI